METSTAQVVERMLGLFDRAVAELRFQSCKCCGHELRQIQAEVPSEQNPTLFHEYRVWFCESCTECSVPAYYPWVSLHVFCTACKKPSVGLSFRVLRTPTYTREGELSFEKTCRHCHGHESVILPIPLLPVR